MKHETEAERGTGMNKAITAFTVITTATAILLYVLIAANLSDPLFFIR